MCLRILRGMAFVAAACLFLTAVGPAQGADWTNSGGNAGRNGLVPEIGPMTAELAWTGSRTSIIA